jgi:hypothetical protein
MDPTGVTLASISLFIQLIKTTDRLYAIYKAISSFDEDFREEQLKLQAQWIIYDNWVNVAELPSSRLPGGHLSEEDTLFVEEFLKLMERHFGDCNQLVGKYTGHSEFSRFLIPLNGRLYCKGARMSTPQIINP